ncbi:MAG: hypothetical protein Kow0019_03570 [Methanobacteriaceae archaeon]
MKKLDNIIQKWLTDEGLFRQNVPDDNSNFHFLIHYPEGHVMDVIQPRGKKDMVIIGCATNVSKEHLDEMNKMSVKDREDFIWDFRLSLNQYSVDFQMQHPNNVLSNFVVTKEIFEDGLTKDKLISTIKKIFRAKIQGVWIIQKKLGVHGNDENGASDSMYV